MRSEEEIREAHGYMMDAYMSAVVDSEYAETDKFALACHALSWALGYGEIFAGVVEIARKTKDDIELDASTLQYEETKNKTFEG